MKIHWSYKFFPYRRKGTGTVSVRMRVTLRGETPVDIATGFVIDGDGWDSEAQRALPSCPDAPELNRTINLWSSLISEVMSRYELVIKRKPTRGEVRELFNDLAGRETAITRSLGGNGETGFFQCFDLFMESTGRKNQWTRATYNRLGAVRRHLASFDPLLSFATLTEQKMQSYVDFMVRDGYKNSTISRQVAFVRWFLRWAYNHEHYTGHIHETFKPKLKGVYGGKEIVYLTREELRLVQDHVFAPEESALDSVRDVFLFCCFTGLRYSDVAKLQRSDIKGDRIKVVTQKTADSLVIELNAHSRGILDKYAGRRFRRELALPVMSNQKMNARLKDVGRLCGLDSPTRVVEFQGNARTERVVPKWELLTTHVARRTFVVTALQLGIPSEVIMRWTGHSDFESMRPYIAIVDEIKRQAMSRFDSL